MHKNKYLFGKNHRLKWFLLWLVLFFLIFSSFPIQANAEDSPDTESPSVGYQTESYTDICHAHRGDSQHSGDCYLTPIYHVHDGNVQSGGGCFTPVKHKHVSSCYTTQTCTMSPMSWEVIDYKVVNCSHHGSQTASTYQVILKHSACGAENSMGTQGGNCNVCGGNVHTETHDFKKLICKKTTSTIDSYTLSCGKTADVTIESYALSCPLEEQKYGTFVMNNNTPQWTSENVVLSCSLDDPAGVIRSDGYGQISFYDANNNLLSDSGDSLSVTENGSYKALLSVDPTRFDTTEVMLNVSNIDRTPPQINDCQYNSGTEWLPENEISFSAVDLQPDQTLGSGLSPVPFSFNSGADWQTDSTYTAKVNGTYEILAKDNCGNISTLNVQIDNIDNEGPTVDVSFSSDEWYEGEDPLNITFSAADNASGLAEHAFSHDGGSTWTSDNFRSVSYPGTYSISVVDKCGNITSVNYNCSFAVKPSSDSPGSDTPPDGPSKKGDDSDTDPDDDSDKKDDNGDSSDDQDDPDKDRSKDKKEKNADSDESDDEKGDRSYEHHNNSTTDIDDNSSATDDSDSSQSNIDTSSTNPDGNPEDKEDTVVSLPNSDSSVPPASPGSTVDYKPFYRTTAFRVASTVSGLAIALLGLAFIFLFLFSGVLIFNYDSSRYRLIAIVPIHHSSRGYCINISDKVYNNRFSGKFRFKLGKIFRTRHKNDKLFVHSQHKLIPIEVDKSIDVEL